MEKEQQVQKTNNRSILGIVLILVGGLFLANNFGFFSEPIQDVLFTWQMLLIGIGTLNILIKGNVQTGLILISVGGFFLLPDIFGYTFDKRVFWPLLLVMVGVILIFVRRRSWQGRKREGLKENYLDAVSIFSGVEKKYGTKNFQGGRLTSIMGGAEIDLREADIQESAEIDLFVMFGGAEIKVPEGWEVQLDALSIFGACEDKSAGIMDPQNKKVLRIKGLVMFGGAELRS